MRDRHCFARLAGTTRRLRGLVSEDDTELPSPLPQEALALSYALCGWTAPGAAITLESVQVAEIRLPRASITPLDFAGFFRQLIALRPPSTLLMGVMKMPTCQKSRASDSAGHRLHYATLGSPSSFLQILAYDMTRAMGSERFTRLRAALCRRQTTLTVLMENVHKIHNYSAILRTCDAVGIQDAHAVSTSLLVATDRRSSASAAKWIDVAVHSDVDAACAVLRGQGSRILAAHFTAEATDFRDVDFTAPTAILLGAEKEGITERAAALVDACIVIPMEGLVGSLNVSVACAVILFEAQRQRRAAGMYDQQHLPPPRFARLLFEWCYPDIADYCRRHSLPYPPLDDEGEIIGDFRQPSRR